MKTLQKKMKKYFDLRKQGKYEEAAKMLENDPYLFDKVYGLKMNGII